MEVERWRRTRRLLESALEREGADRAAFLESVAAGDPALRAELLSLIAHAEHPAGFLESGAHSLPADDAGEEREPLLGRTFGHYTIDSRLGRGGMGEVFLAYDLRLERRVALKLLAPRLNADERWRARFLREARLASALDHPNICVIHEVGEAEGRAFIAMQHIEGSTLAELIDGRPLALEKTLSISAQVAEALAAAHERGIVHCDIKPGNIVVTPRGRAMVLDFGIASRFDAPATADESELSAAGVVLGTPASMSPEQAGGGAADPRSDIFSLGVVIYEMATGVRPFAGESREEVFDAVRARAHVPAMTVDSGIPSALSALIDRALAKDPAQRYPSMPALIADLAAVAGVHGASPEASAAPAPRRPAAWRHLGLAAAVLALAGLGATFLLRGRGVSQPIRSLAVLPFSALVAGQSDEALEVGMADTLIARLEALPQIRVRPITAVSRYARSEPDAVAAGREQRVDAVLEGHLQQDGDTVRVTVRLIRVADAESLWTEQFDAPMTGLFAVQDSIAERVAAALEVRLTGDERSRLTHDPTENPEAYRRYLLGRFHLNRWTDEGLWRGLGYFEEAIRIDPDYALAHAGVAQAYNTLAAFNALAPKDAFPKAKRAAAEALRLDDRLAEAHFARAEATFLHDWSWEEAERQYRRALELGPSSAIAHQSYGYFLTMSGRFDEALLAMRRAQELDPLSLPAIVAVGEVLHQARRFDEAEAQVRKALDMDPNFGFAHWALGRSLTERGMFEPAIAALKRSIPLSGDSPDEPAELARAYALSGRRAEALAIAEDLIGQSGRRYVAPSVIASVYAALGDRNEAFEWLAEALRQRDFVLVSLQVEPMFDPLRDDPRFEELLAGMNFR